MERATAKFGFKHEKEPVITNSSSSHEHRNPESTTVTARQCLPTSKPSITHGPYSSAVAKNSLPIHPPRPIKSSTPIDCQKENIQLASKNSLIPAETGLPRFRQQPTLNMDNMSLIESSQKLNASKAPLPLMSLQQLQDNNITSNIFNSSIGIMNDGAPKSAAPSCTAQATFNEHHTTNPLRPNLMRMSLPSSLCNSNPSESEAASKKRGIAQHDESDPSCSKRINPYVR